MYVLFNVVSAHGAFVGQIRSEVQDVIDEIRKECFISQDIKEKYVDFLHSYFKAAGDNPWAEQRTIQVPFIAARTTNGSLSSCKSSLRI